MLFDLKRNVEQLVKNSAEYCKRLNKMKNTLSNCLLFFSSISFILFVAVWKFRAAISDNSLCMADCWWFNCSHFNNKIRRNNWIQCNLELVHYPISFDFPLSHLSRQLLMFLRSLLLSYSTDGKQVYLKNWVNWIHSFRGESE